MIAVEQPKIAIDPLDLVDINHSLSDDERAIRDVVRKFCADQLAPYVSEWYRAGVLPREIAPTLGGLGLLGMHLKDYGCAGTNAVSYGLACQELEAVDSGLRSLVSVQGSLAMFAIWRFGSEDQKKEWLPDMATGRVLGCFGLTEADSGSDPSSMRTTARRDGTDWVLDGTKMWITNGGICDVAIIWARTDEGIRGFVVPRETTGFSVRDIGLKLSLRASVTSELCLQSCRVPQEAMLPTGLGLRAPLACLDEARFGIVWGSMGAARSAYGAALDYASTRVQFNRAIAGFQLTQEKLVNMLVELSKGNLLALHLGRLKDRGALLPQQISLGKLNNVRAALEICRSARTVLGASGITLEYPVMRHMNNLESVLTYEGTSEVHMLVVGQAITGVQAFR